MSLKSRRFSLDSSVSRNGGGVFGGRKSSVTKSRQRQSLDEARLEIQEFNRSLHSSASGRDMTIAAESQERPHELMNPSSQKYNKSFHKLFPDIPEWENLTHVFTCALQKEVLYQGKLFVSKNHVCFHSSVLLKDTKVVIPTSSVREVKKQSSALFMLSIQVADGEKYSFASLMNRELCHKLLESLCSYAQRESSNSSPHLSSEENPADPDVISNYSSTDDSFAQDRSRQNSTDYDNFPELESEGATRSSSTPDSSPMDTNDRESASWIRSVVEKAASLVSLRQMKNLSVFFYIYFMLIVMLLLASGYLSLKIIALEEQLNSLGVQTELSLHHREFQET